MPLKIQGVESKLPLRGAVCGFCGLGVRVNKYYVRRGSLVRGPFTSEEIKAKISAKQLKRSDEVSLGQNGPWDLLGDAFKQILEGSYLAATKGEQVAPMIATETGICEDCGKSVSEDDEACRHCGSLLDDDEGLESLESEETDNIGQYVDHGSGVMEDSSYDDGLGLSVDQLDEYGNVTAGNVLSVGEAVGSVGSAFRDAKETLGKSKNIPSEVRELLADNEAVLYAGRPSELALKIKVFCLGVFLFILCIVPLLGVRAAGGGTGALLFGGVFGLSAFAFGWYLMRTEWKNTIYLVTDKRIVVRKGIFSRGIRLIPVRNIQTMSVETGIIDRWLGFNKVAFVTSAALFGGTVFRHVDSAEVMQAVGKALMK